MSFPWRKYYGYKGGKSDEKRKIIMQARDIRETVKAGNKASNTSTYIPPSSEHGRILQSAEDIKKKYQK